MTRRLAAIFAADVVGYSRLMGVDEVSTLAALKAHRRELVDPTIAAHHGRIVNTAGDGLLAEFQSVVEAVLCAVEVQRGIAERNATVAEDRRIEFRVGINLGDIIADGEDIHGDGVNIAARLEGLARAGGICVSRPVHDQVRDKLDVAFEDLGEQEVKNIARRVHVFRVALGPPLPEPPRALALPDKPSIVVLPFQNMSGDPGQEYFADGMVEEITTALARGRSLFVIARNSAFAYKGKPIDIKRVGAELGVRYVLEGSVRKASDRVRVTGQLIDVATLTHIWAERFEGGLGDIFDLQDKIASSVIGAIVPTIEKAEIALATRKPTTSLGAYDHYLRGMSAFYRYTNADHREALPLFERAAALDPSFALAYAGQAHWYVTGKAWGWIEGSGAEVRQAERVAREALRLGSDDPRVLAVAGQAITYVATRIEEGEAILSRAVELDPNLATARLWLGGARRYRGRFEEAIEQYQLALRLSPLDPRIFLAYSGTAFAHFLAGRYGDALEWASTGARRWPGFVHLHYCIMSALAMLDRLEEAVRSRDSVLRLSPTLTIAEFRRKSTPWRPEDIEKVAVAWRRAGMPE